jgi:hypothetical protein
MAETGKTDNVKSVRAIKPAASGQSASPASTTTTTTTTKNSKQTKMPTPQEMQELYDKITPLQKIVTLQHIYSLYMAASQQSEKKEVSFNIIQLQRMINCNPLVNPDFDFLNISGFLNNSKEKNKEKLKDKNSSASGGSTISGNTGSSSNKGPVSPVQLIQILTESLTLRDERGRNEQVIQQVPNTMLFKLSKFIDLNFVKDRLIKLLNAYKNSTLKEIEELENKWKIKKSEIQKIEEGKMDDSVLYEEFLKDLKKKRSSSIISKDRIDSKKVKAINVSGTGGTSASTSVSTSASVSASASASNSPNVSTNSSPSPNINELQGKKLQISRNVNRIVEKNSENLKEIVNERKTQDVKQEVKELKEENKKEAKEDIFVDAFETVHPETTEPETAEANETAEATEVMEEHLNNTKENKKVIESPGKHKLEEDVNIEDSSSKRIKKEESMKDNKEFDEKEPVKTRSRTRSMVNNEIATKAENKKFQQLSIQLITHISSHRIASMFLNPVNANDEPQYYELIKRPVDLKTIVKKIKSGNIVTLEELELEMQIMFTNAIMYNDMNQEDVYKGILDMMKEWEGLVSMLKENM